MSRFSLFSLRVLRVLRALGGYFLLLRVLRGSVVNRSKRTGSNEAVVTTERDFMTRYRKFDLSQIELEDLQTRENQVALADCLHPGEAPTDYDHPEFGDLCAAINTARQNDRPVILMIGAHVVKQGMSRFVIDLMQRGWVTHVATNGAGIIHDFEMARIGGTSEDVARYIKAGQFGMWKQTGLLNLIVAEGHQREEGIGEAVGRVIENEQFPNREASLCATGYRLGIPVTSHVNIGADIVHSHPNCNGAAWGGASYTDFLIFAEAVSRLEGGVFLNVGSAVTGPEVYLKALSMARNCARQRGEEIRRFSTAVFDLVDLPDNFRDGPPGKSHAQYYYRPWKTILVRTVADGGQSYYFRGDHRVTIPAMHQRLTQFEKRIRRAG